MTSIGTLVEVAFFTAALGAVLGVATLAAGDASGSESDSELEESSGLTDLPEPPWVVRLPTPTDLGGGGGAAVPSLWASSKRDALDDAEGLAAASSASESDSDDDEDDSFDEASADAEAVGLGRALPPPPERGVGAWPSPQASESESELCDRLDLDVLALRAMRRAQNLSDVFLPPASLVSDVGVAPPPLCCCSFSERALTLSYMEK